jgi:hypothetical protein
MMSVYGFCTSGTRKLPFVPVIFRFENFHRRNGSHKIPLFQRVLWWARQGLNLRPHPCEGKRLHYLWRTEANSNERQATESTFFFT